MTSSDYFRTVEEYLGEVTLDLFKEGGVILAAPQPDCPPARSPGDTVVASIIGYAGETIRGALILLAEADTIRSWQPRASPDAPLDIVHDKIGEFCNQLLGRLKYRLMLQGVSFLLGTPITTSSAGLTVGAPVSGSSRWLQFVSASGTLNVRLDAVFEAGFALEPDPGLDAPARAGEMMLF